MDTYGDKLLKLQICVYKVDKVCDNMTRSHVTNSHIIKGGNPNSKGYIF